MRLLHIYLSPEHNFFGHHGQPAGRAPTVEVPEATAVAGQGLVGDRFFGHKDDYKGQVTLFSIETYRDLCSRFGLAEDAADVSLFRRNLVVEGADLPALIGTEFELCGVRFLGTEEAAPCYWMNQAFADGAEEAMRGRGGLRAKVLTGGILRSERNANALA
ncbi:MOSC domain-containing protein [soil metagenome]